MNHTVKLCHDKQTHTVTLTMRYDNEPDARVAYLNLFALLSDQHHASVVAEAPPYIVRRDVHPTD